MLVFEYQQKDLLDVTWDSINREQPFEVIISGKKIKILRRFITTFRKYIEAKERGIKNKRLLFPLALYGIWFPTFGATLIHASTWRVETRLDGIANRLIVSFVPDEVVP